MCGCAQRREIVVRAAGHAAAGDVAALRADVAGFAASAAADLAGLRAVAVQRLAAARARLAGRR